MTEVLPHLTNIMDKSKTPVYDAPCNCGLKGEHTLSIHGTSPEWDKNHYWVDHEVTERIGTKEWPYVKTVKVTRPSANQTFRIDLTLKKDCSEFVDEAEVKGWLEELFNGCEMGEVTVDLVKEVADIQS